MENGTLHVARVMFFVKMIFKIDQKSEKSVHGAFGMENGKPNGSERLSVLRARTLLEHLWRGNGAPKVASGTPWAWKVASKIEKCS